MKKFFPLLMFAMLFFFSTTNAHAAFLPFGPIEYEQAEKLAEEASSKDPVAGIYELTKGNYRGRFLVLPNDLKERPEAKYVGIIVRTKNPHEPIGAIKFWLTVKEAPKTYIAEYYDFNVMCSTKGSVKAYVLPSIIMVYVSGLSSRPPNQFIKIYP